MDYTCYECKKEIGIDDQLTLIRVTDPANNKRFEAICENCKANHRLEILELSPTAYEIEAERQRKEKDYGRIIR